MNSYDSEEAKQLCGPSLRVRVYGRREGVVEGITQEGCHKVWK